MPVVACARVRPARCSVWLRRCLLAWGLLGAAVAPVLAAPVRAAVPDDAPRVIVRWRADAAALAGPRAAGPQGARLAARRLDAALEDGPALAPDTQVLRARSGSTAALLAALARDPQVLWVAPDRRRRRLAVPNDPLFAPGLTHATPAAGQWALHPTTAAIPAATQAQLAWDVTRGQPGVVVAVLDSGILRQHPDLSGTTVLPGWDFISDPVVANDGDGPDGEPADPGDWVIAAEAADPNSPLADCLVEDSSWHGTMVAGLVAATSDNGLGMAGMAPGVSLLPLRVLGKCGGYDSDIIAAMRWAAGLPVPGMATNPRPARVVNLSLGSADACTSAYAAAVRDVTNRGALVVAAAGNRGMAAGAPANCPGVLAVSGVDHRGFKASYADMGPAVGLSAPSGDCLAGGAGCQYPLIQLTDTGRRWPTESSYTDASRPTPGTSFSAALVSGAAALLWSVNPALTVAEVRALLQRTARPFPAPQGDIAACAAASDMPQGECACSASTCGAGMLDVAAAVQAARVLAPAPAPSAPQQGSAAASSPAPVVPSSGAGALSPVWLLGLLALAALMATVRRRQPSRAPSASR